MCYKCGKEWKEIPSEFPCGPCSNKWICPDCGEQVSPCCGAEIIDINDCQCDTCEYCGTEHCKKCGDNCHCSGCV